MTPEKMAAPVEGAATGAETGPGSEPVSIIPQAGPEKQGRPISALSDAELQAAGQEARAALRHYRPDPLDLYFPPGTPERARQDRQRAAAHYRALINSERAQAVALVGLLAEHGHIDPQAEAALLYMARGLWGAQARAILVYALEWDAFLELAFPITDVVEALLAFYCRLSAALAAAGIDLEVAA